MEDAEKVTKATEILKNKKTKLTIEEIGNIFLTD